MPQKENSKQELSPADQKIIKKDAEHYQYPTKKAPGVQKDSEPVGGA